MDAREFFRSPSGDVPGNLARRTSCLCPSTFLLGLWLALVVGVHNFTLLLFGVEQ